MRSLICIVCPVGCPMEINDSANGNLSVTGNKCQRGEVYALEEIRAPKRVVTATVSLTEIGHSSVRRIPVKTTFPCPREMIPALLQDIYKTKVSLPVKAGDVIIAGWKEQGIDVVATRTVD